MTALMILSYLAYFALLPLGILILLRKIWYDEGYLKIANEHWTSKRKVKEVKDLEKKLKMLKVFSVLFLILVLPLWGIAASEITDRGVRTTIIGDVFAPVIRDDVVHSLGPSYDVDSIIEEMYNRSRLWFPELINEYVDLDGMTSKPGRIGVYLLTGARYIITYTYLAPIPIVEAHGFVFRTSDNGREILFYRTETYIFPFNPANAGELADI